MATAQQLVLEQSLAEYYAASINSDPARQAQAIDALKSRIERVPGIAELVASEISRLGAIVSDGLENRCHASAMQLKALKLATGVLQ
jgi:hypothetical protein